MKRVTILVCLGFIVLSTMASAQSSGLPGGLEGQDPREVIDDITNKSLWSFDYLSKEWKNLLMNNSMVSGIDKGLTKADYLFLPIVGKGYSFSLEFLILILLWIYFVVLIFNIVRFKFQSQLVSLAIGVGGACILGIIQFLRGMGYLISKLIAMYDSTIYAAVVAIVIILVLVVVNNYVSAMQKNKEEKQPLKDVKKLKRELKRELKRGKYSGRDEEEDLEAEEGKEILRGVAKGAREAVEESEEDR